MRSLTEAHGYTTDKCLQITTHGLTPSYKHSSRPTHASFKSTSVSNGNRKAPHRPPPSSIRGPKSTLLSSFPL